MKELAIEDEGDEDGAFAVRDSSVPVHEDPQVEEPKTIATQEPVGNGAETDATATTSFVAADKFSVKESSGAAVVDIHDEARRSPSLVTSSLRSRGDAGDIEASEGRMLRDKQPTAAVTLGPAALNGSRRYVVDGLISDIKCKILSALVHVAGERGDGYHRNVNPHTEAEEFFGLTLSRTGLADMLRLVLRVTSVAKQNIEQHFELQRPLYFSFTHLVCRTAKPGPYLQHINGVPVEYYDTRPPGDLSHVVHVDNCILYGPGECLQRPPAYTFRDYSAILYLNDDFEGGEFVFTDDPQAKAVQSSVTPKCGRMVAFSAGPENPHGVKAVRRGSRCALALWFTHDAKHRDKDRILAETLLNKIKLGEIKVK
ncbi:hypothetical protein HAZT_HAZT005329 [Hyalella azteca]|uniref:procollagen-proline 3-dioxygenase n=1 Tax=Hyalella azteca TaxID=294128 RepID=A0A6A0GS55_HYAAZ|nr:hypothetical protein HAZT_HAZT005329 [Hyalella azteca]